MRQKILHMNGEGSSFDTIIILLVSNVCFKKDSYLKNHLLFLIEEKVGTSQLKEIAVSFYGTWGKCIYYSKSLQLINYYTHILFNHSSAVQPGKDHLTTEIDYKIP